MSGAPALVAVDLDGTLLRTDGTVSDRTVAALRLAESAGARVALVTGRPARFVVPLAARTGGHETVICSNGALVWDLSAQQPVVVRGIEPAVVIQLGGLIRGRVPEVLFAVEQARGISREPGWPTLDPRNDTGARTGPLALIADATVVKLLIRGARGTDGEQLRRTVAAVVGDRLELTRSVPGSIPLLEASAPGVHKGTALAEFAGSLGIAPAAVVAFGDMPNDTAMLAWAGTGVAMGNADPSVRAVADRVTATNDEDGVAMVLEDLFG